MEAPRSCQDRPLSGREALSRLIKRAASPSNSSIAARSWPSGLVPKAHRARGVSGKVALRDYLEAICVDLVSTITDNHQLQIETEVDDIEFDGPMALKLALMISELVMNSVKHAPQERAPLVVHVIFRRNDGGYRLAVEDNGQGLPAAFDPSVDSGVGMRILQTLSADLNTAMQIERQGGGARFAFDIPAP